MSARPVFISFSSRDRRVAETICDALERLGHGCWISCRNIAPGANFQESIVQAIRVSRLMILVFTSNANNSGEITKELALASQNNLVVIPVRVEDVVPNDAFAYEFATRQWIDMFDDWDRSIHRLATQIETVLGVQPGEDRAAPKAVRSAKLLSTNLPHLATPLIGRETELAAIEARIGQHRLVTLVGSGGVGKTRISIQAGTDLAQRFPDGVWFLELAPATDPSQVAELLCSLLVVPLSDNRPPIEAATGFLRQKTLLLILDNCEHLVEAASRVADAVIKNCPDVRILASSREALGVPGEAIYRMPTLAVPPDDAGLTAESALQFGAVRLFTERAAEVLGAYVLTDADAPAVAAICRRLDGIALAIELAAPRLKVLKPAQLLTRLDDRFRILTGGKRTALPRQQTLRALVDWSYTLLAESEKQLMRRLSVFAAGWTLEAAAAVAGGSDIEEWEVLDLLDSLVDKSLVVADQSGEETRYRFLETTRAYAVEKLAEAGESGCHKRAAEYLAALLRRADREWETTPADLWIATYGEELNNVRAAFDWAFGPDGDVSIGLAIAAFCGRLWVELSLPVELGRRMALAASHLDAATPPDIASRIYDRQVVTNAVGLVAGRNVHRLAVDLARHTGEPVHLAHMLSRLAGSLSSGDTLDEAAILLDEALAIARAQGRGKLLGRILGSIGNLAGNRGDAAAGRLAYEEGLAVARAAGDVGIIAAIQLNIALDHARAGDNAAAISVGREAIVAARAVRSRVYDMYANGNLALCLALEGEIADAIASALLALGLARSLEDRPQAVNAMIVLALAAAQRGDLALAARLQGFADAVCESEQIVHDITNQAVIDRTLALLAAGLPAAEERRLIAEGAVLTLDQAAEAGMRSVRLPVQAD